MEKVLVAKKGYTIEVVSWENDGDNYKTNYLTVGSKEEALKIQKICKELFCSCHNGESGIGNSTDGETYGAIEDYLEENPEIGFSVDRIDELASDLLGYSEFYDYRVCERSTITFLEEDVYAEVIS